MIFLLSTQVHVISMGLWCLSPSVAIECMKRTRAFLLTSGTLSPMDSFASELGVPFPIKLEADHVIDESQAWVSAIGYGPAGTPMNCSFKYFF